MVRGVVRRGLTVGGLHFSEIERREAEDSGIRLFILGFFGTVLG